MHAITLRYQKCVTKSLRKANAKKTYGSWHLIFFLRLIKVSPSVYWLLRLIISQNSGYHSLIRMDKQAQSSYQLSIFSSLYRLISRSHNGEVPLFFEKRAKIGSVFLGVVLGLWFGIFSAFVVRLASGINRLLPKSLFTRSKTFFDKSKARSRRCQSSPLGLKQLTLFILHFAKISWEKRFNHRSKGFPFRQQPVKA